MKPYERKVDMNATYVKFAIGLLKSLKIRYRFVRRDVKTTWLGMALADKEMIVINLRPIKRAEYDEEGDIKYFNESLTMQEFLSTVFHEIQHIVSRRQGKFLHYQRGLDFKNTTQRSFNKWASEFLDCERHCDTEGERMMKRYYESIPYLSNYKGKVGKIMVYKSIVEYAEFFNFTVDKEFKRYLSVNKSVMKQYVTV